MIRIIERIPIDKGWSADKKYRVRDERGNSYLMRVSPAEQCARKRAQFDMMRRVAELGVPMCEPVEFGACEEGVYSILSWIDGEDAEERIPRMTEARQYAFGVRAGEILRRIHEIPAPDGLEAWDARMNRKIDRKIRNYAECPVQFEGAQNLIAYIAENRHLLSGRPQTYQHGDYHIGNMMIAKGELVIIDFDRDDFGDPWEEFNRIVWCAQKSPLFASGMVNGYFGGRPPAEFWRLLALYIASNTLSSVPWAIPFGQKEVDVMLNQAREVLAWYDGMKRAVPSWYFEGFYLQRIDGILYKMKSPFDFSFVQKYGHVFQVFDDQDSGNICFGVASGEKRLFLKFAGAPTAGYDGQIADAVARLKACADVYRELAHPALVNLVDAREESGGYLLIFDWADGDCMGRMYPDAHARFLALPLEAKLSAFRDILTLPRACRGERVRGGRLLRRQRALRLFARQDHDLRHRPL